MKVEKKFELIGRGGVYRRPVGGGNGGTPLPRRDRASADASCPNLHKSRDTSQKSLKVGGDSEFMKISALNLVFFYQINGLFLLTGKSTVL